MEHYSSATLKAYINYINGEASLDLSGKGLSRVPDAVTELSEVGKLRLNDKLEWLSLGRNNVKELPAGVGDLMELTTLDLSENQLVGLPTTIKKLNKFKELYLDVNKVTELPPEIFYLKELIALNVGMNQLVVLPSNIPKLSKLMWLMLDKNKLTELPAEIGDLK